MDRVQTLSKWLENTVGRPMEFETDEESLLALERVMLRSERARRDGQVADAHMKNHIEELKTEIARMREIVEPLGVAPEDVHGLGAVAQVASALGVGYPSVANLLLALQDTVDDHHQATKRLSDTSEKVAAQMDATRAALKQLKELKTERDKLADSTTTERAQDTELVHSLPFLATKASDYRQRATQLEAQLRETGYRPEISHSTVITLARAVRDLETEMQPLARELSAFEALPVDVHLARMKIEEAKREVQRLEAMLRVSVEEIRL